jgi:lipopolysaccharide export LptBFGC system permease protein LptF
VTGRANDEDQAEVKYDTFTERELNLEPASYFKTDEPNADLMTYGQLNDYIDRLNASGANVVPQRVALARKVAFPFVTVIMTILAVPFAVSTGRHGAMYGVGIGIALAITYIVAMSIAGALGAGGALPPLLAAWAPNILFGAAAMYMVLTVRT